MPKPKVVADGPLAPEITARLSEKVEILPWSVALQGSPEPIAGIYTYGHPRVDGAMLDRLAGVRIISSYGVGVDHIVLADAAARRIPVGNTPGVLDGATADMAFALLLASARRLVEGDRYARSPGFTVYDPGYMLGREIHGATIGIVGLGRIGRPSGHGASRCRFCTITGIRAVIWKPGLPPAMSRSTSCSKNRITWCCRSRYRHKRGAWSAGHSSR